MREGAFINKSLSALTTVMAALANGNKRPPFRDSVVTQLLAGPLSDGVTSIIVAVSPAPSGIDNTIASIRFGQRFLKRLKVRRLPLLQIRAGPMTTLVDAFGASCGC